METDSVGGLINRTVPQDNRSLLLQKRGLVVKLQLPVPQWFDQKVNGQMTE